MEIIEHDEKGILKRIQSMILPITAENILQMMAGIVSMAMIGRISPLAVGAIGIGSILFRIIWAIFKGISTGATVLVAQSHGANNNKRLALVSEQGLILSIFISIILQQLLFWNAEFFLKIFNPSPELLADGIMYSRIISWSIPFSAIILIVSGILQGMGNAKVPMKIIGSLNIINIVFCYLLIFGNLGFPKLGLRGAAIAYVISYFSAAIMSLFALFGTGGAFTKLGEKFKLQFNKEETLQLIKFGVPTAFETSFWQFASVIITRAILTYGETAYAAYQLGLQAEAISYMPAAGFSIAASAFVGQAIGSKDRELGKKYLNHLIKLSIIITAFASAILVFFPSVIMRILTDDQEVIKIGARYLLLMGLVQIPQNLAHLLNGALRGAGFAKIPMINVGVGIWLVRVPLVLLMTYVVGLDINWIWFSIITDLIIRFILAIITFKKKDIFNDNIVME